MKRKVHRDSDGMPSKIAPECQPKLTQPTSSPRCAMEDKPVSKALCERPGSNKVSMKKGRKEVGKQQKFGRLRRFCAGASGGSV